MIDLAHIHPMLVHFPLALLPVALGAQALVIARGNSLFGRSCAAQTGFWLTMLAAIGALAAAVFGDIALDRAVASGIPLTSLETHEELGQLTAVLLSLLAAAEVWLYRKSSGSTTINRGTWIAEIIVLAFLLTTAWFGGQLVYKLGVNVTPPAPSSNQTIERP